ncbi:PIN domain-containing protein [Kribbella antiqua]|uniref:PIN domain-containing protein n=1 Tax=Kribbella antiqua TaxID=2512217 RepID=A0A4R2ILN9_9ACTN|nr:PIN domain-containing protein [Kribbella antiqua]TCO45216.1 PIN domain-containing protein [Kribbella antiqua]
MLVTLTPGVNRDHVLELLRKASVEITNKYGDQDGYVRWALDTARTLRGQIAQTDLEQLLLTPAFYRLVDPVMMGTPQGLWLLQAEMSDRQALLVAAFEALQEQIGTWTAAAGKVLSVVDSSVFLSHPAWTQDDDPTAVIASIPWAEELGVGFEDVLLVLPEVVIRELDRLKESGNQKTRYRASVTLAVIDKLLDDPYGTVPIRLKDADWDAVAARGEMPRGGIELRVFYDDPAHRPLSDPDAEVIDRAMAVQTLAGAEVRLLTMDTGMGLNARRAKLLVRKPARAIESPPPEGQSARARRRAATQAAEPESPK